MKRARPKSVFVPYEKLVSGPIIRARDLPRFVEPQHVIDFLREHRELSNRLLDWREEFDTDSINEYMTGVGELDLKKPLMPQLISLIDKKH